MNTQYFFKTGHCQPLAIAEFESLTRSSDNFTDKNYIFSDKKLNINRTGSLVFGGVVLYTIKDWNIDKMDELHEVLKDSITIGIANGKFKKTGISTPYKLANDLIKVAKEAGAKKVNILKDVLPNFGHWKSTNDWIIIIPQGKDLVIGEVMDYSDQQFWSKLDTRLPHGDMKRGIINLKLGRSLLNLTDKKIIWDPFCGQGRIMCAGLDIKQEYYNSDIDEVVIPDVIANYEFAHYQMEKRHKNLAVNKDVFQMDAINLADNYFTPQMQRAGTINELAIVTEGNLGHNFEETVTEKDAAAQLKQIHKIWKPALAQAKEAGIEELIFCLPFYQFKRSTILPEFVKEVVEENGYSLTKFGKQFFILYSRPRSRVGHYIVRVTMNKD